MPRKHQKPLGVAPFGGFAKIPKIIRSLSDEISSKYELPSELTFKRFESLSFDWKMDASICSTATDQRVSTALERLAKAAGELRQAWDYLELHIEEGMLCIDGKHPDVDDRIVTTYDALRSVFAAIIQLATIKGLEPEDFRQWIIFLSELSPQIIGYDKVSSRQGKAIPLRRIIKSLCSYWIGQKGTMPTAYWSDVDERTKTNEGGELVRDAAALITGKRPTPDQLREAFRAADNASTGGDSTPGGGGSSP